ncbi:ice-binding family protein [Ferrimicrobium acidiphilum]|uniref:ice-binding family protein n=2 Tax=Ferrimicrobium acidiphilum TaxID=121039 RepID=UPI003C6CF504
MRLKNAMAEIRRNARWPVLTAGASAVVVGAFVTIASPSAFAGSVSSVVLGTAGSYSVLAGSTVTNTGSSTLQGDLGLSPGSAVTGFPPGLVGGATNVDNANALQAQTDASAAYTQAADMTPATPQPANLAGLTLSPGVYSVPAGTSNLTGTLTLDGEGNPSGVFIFQMPSTLITSSSSSIILTNDANPCNIFWQVTSSATLGTNSSFQGTVLALTSITANTSATINGRLLARNGAVTLDSNRISNPVCLTTTSTPPTTTTSKPPTTTTSTPPTTTTSTPPTTLVVPATHTGEPWSGWLWWIGVALIGSTGLVLLRPKIVRFHRIR